MSHPPGLRLARRPAFALLSLFLAAAGICYVVARPPAARAASVITVTNTNDVTIQGPGASQLTISGNNASRVFLILSGNTVTLDGLTVSGGRSGADGGGIFKLTGTVTISNCVVSGNVAAAGGDVASGLQLRRLLRPGRQPPDAQRGDGGQRDSGEIRAGW